MPANKGEQGMAAPARQLSNGNPGGSGLRKSATDLISFYGVTPVTQRTSSIQAASVVSALSFISVTSNLAAWAAEVSSTFAGLGIWKGQA
jgi:hypothetical protein